MKETRVYVLYVMMGIDQINSCAVPIERGFLGFMGDISYFLTGNPFRLARPDQKAEDEYIIDALQDTRDGNLYVGIERVGTGSG